MRFSDDSKGHCDFYNDKNGITNKPVPTKTLNVKRAYDDLIVECELEDGREVNDRFESSADYIWGNLLIGGVIGAGIDRMTEKGYSYPEVNIIDVDGIDHP